MREIAADAGALLVDVMRRLHVTRMLVAEGDVVVDEIDDRLHPRPAGGVSPKTTTRRCR